MEKNARVDHNTPSVISGRRDTVVRSGEAVTEGEVKKASALAEQQRRLQNEMQDFPEVPGE